MNVSPFRIFSIKLAIFSIVLAYLAVDLFLLHGPVWRTLHPETSDRSSTSENAQPPLARVYGEDISSAQFARFSAEQNWLRNRTETTRGQRAAMLMDMVRGAILRLRARYNDKNLPDFSRPARDEVTRLASRAKSDKEFDIWLASQGYTREMFTKKLEATMKMRAQLERAVAPFCVVRDEDVAEHYERIRESMRIPEHRSVKHIFFATHGKDPQAVRQQAENVLRQLHNGADFAALALRYSEDDNSSQRGGDLGTIFNDEHFVLPELPLFGKSSVAPNVPTLAQSRWGWHILLAGELQPSRIPSLDECKESVRSAIRSAQYELSVRSWFDEAIHEAFNKKRLDIHVD